MMKRTPKTPALAKLAMLLLFAIAAVAILDTTSISAQELGRTITSPFGIARQTSASESGTDGDTFVDPETGEVGHIIRNPFGVANPEGVDTGIDIPDDAGEEVGGIITSPFGVPASDDIDTGVDVIDEDEEYLISLPDEETDVDEREPVEDEGNADDTLDDAKDIEEESYEATTEKYVPVIDNPMRGVEFDSIITLSGTSTYTVESETNDINNAPTLYVFAGEYFTLNLVTNLNLPTNIQPIFRKLNQSGTQNPFGPLQSGSNPPYCFVYHVPTTMDGGTYCASISCTFNGVPIERILKIEIVRVKKIVGPNSKSSTRSEAPSGTDKWQESEVIYAQPYSVFDLTMEVEPSLSYDKIKDLISWSKSGVGGTLTPKENNKRKAEFKATTTGRYTITASIGSSHKIILVKVVAPQINTVEFGGAKINIRKDTDGSLYSGVAWKDDNLDGKSELDNANADSDVKYQPVAYPSTSKITAQGTFKPNCLKIDKEGTSNPDSSDFIQGWDVEAAVKKYRFSHDNSNWSNWKESGPVEDSNPISAVPKVGYNLEYQIFWEYGFGETGTDDDDSLHNVSAGTSEHEMYFTKREYVGAAFETVLHISCTSANDKTVDDQIVASVWGNFCHLSVKKKGSTTTLKYYGAGTSTGLIFTVAGLLSAGDGRCGAWARFFRDCIILHVETAKVKVKGVQPDPGTYPAAANGFLVKNWNVHEATRTQNNFSHLLYTVSCSASSPHQNGACPGTGINGQGPNVRPQSFFADHAVVLYLSNSSTVYDPSYGGSYGYDTFLIDYKTASIQGFYIKENGHKYATFDKDINNLKWGYEE